MPAKMVVELPSGDKVYFGGEGPATGLAEVADDGEVAKIAGGKFERALGSLGTLVATLERTVGAMAKRPDKVELEFGASLTTECDLWIVSGEGTAEFKVTVAWGKGD
jgi:hypothetical protein